MHRRTAALCTALGTGLALLMIAPGVSTALTLYGVESARFRWAPASGPVSYYRVYVSTNGGELERYGRANGNEAVVQASFGQTIAVSVVAVSSSDGSFVEGPFSARSENVRFVEDPSSGPGADPEPTPEPGSEPGSGPGSDPQAATSFDFDADGRSDLLVRNSETGALRVWSMDGTRVVDESVLFVGPTRPLVAVGDFDGDGTADLVYYISFTRTLRFFLTGADTGGIPLAAGWYVDASGDFDGDGRDDLLLRDSNSAAMAVWLMDGVDRLEIVQLFDLDDSWQVRTGDFNADGTDDLVVTGSAGQTVGIVLMAGGASIAMIPLGETEAGWELRGVGDLDADGMDDLVFQHTQGNVQVWFMDGPEIAGTGNLGSIGSGWEVAKLIDLDGNLTSDLLWSRADGRLYAGLWDGLTLLSHGPVATLAENWELVNP